jgi:farnesyl diphosphate synthase/geranylgeranyl diphosphate synthase type II
VSRSVLLPDASVGARRESIDAALAACCDEGIDGVDAQVAGAIRYALLGEGKRLRGLLVCAAYDAVGGTGDPVGLATAVEVVHAYSLVHDDLPCMDDDDVRRGRPTVHRVFGVVAATAAGLAMVPLAARHAYRAAMGLGLDAAASGEVVRELMAAAGAGGMIGGQLLDLEGEGHALDLAGLERIHRAKTGALITAAVVLGGLAAGADAGRRDALRRYGEGIGLAFQIADDVLDVTATTDELGKTAGRDLDLRKSTYPALLGVEGATGRARALVEEACAALEHAELLTPALEQVARFTVTRRS